MSCLLRVSGKALDIDALVSSVPLIADRYWKKGDPRSRAAKSSHENWGANFLASDADLDEFGKQVAEATAFLDANLASVSRLASFPGVERISLDFGVALNVDTHGAVYSYLPPSLIHLTAQANIGVEISTYVCSDEHTGVES